MSDKKIEDMSVLEVYAHGIDLLQFIVNQHPGNKRVVRKAVNTACDVIRATAFKKNYPELAHLIPKPDAVQEEE